MKAMTYTAAREGLASAMDQVCRDRAPVVITRNRDQAVVMMSLDDYEELEETAHLLRSPNNAVRLLLAIQCPEAGKGKMRRVAPEP
jgi:antitoxin YefM